ncbi:MAG: hypothetical protein ACOVOU_01985, partial [Rubrivivax sp.]
MSPVTVYVPRDAAALAAGADAVARAVADEAARRGLKVDEAAPRGLEAGEAGRVRVVRNGSRGL